MHPVFQRLMNQATRLVRQGDLQAATAAIQAALNETVASAPDAPGMRPAASDIVIDVEAREGDAPSLQQAKLDGPQVPPPSSLGAGTFLAGRFSDGRTQRQF